MIFCYPIIGYGSEFCLFTEVNGVWIFEPGDYGDWFYYKGHIYKIRDPVDAGIHFNSKTFRFEINDRKLRTFLEHAMRRETWKFMKLGWDWTISTEYEGKAWGFAYGSDMLNNWGDIDDFIKVVKEWLTGRGGKPIFDLEGEVDLPVGERYRKVLGDGEHVKVVARHDIDGDREEEVAIATAVDRDWRSPGYVYIWKGEKLKLKYRLGGVAEKYDEAVKPGVIEFFNLNQISGDEVIVFWISVWRDPKGRFYLPECSFTILSFDDLEKLCDPWGKLKRAKEEYKKSGGK